MKNSKLYTLGVILLLALINFANAQGLTEAANKFSQEAAGVKNAVQTGLMAIAFICAGIGLIGALSKTNVEGEQGAKNFIKWFVAAGLFGLAWGLMSVIFR